MVLRVRASTTPCYLRCPLSGKIPCLLSRFRAKCPVHSTGWAILFPNRRIRRPQPQKRTMNLYAKHRPQQNLLPCRTPRRPQRSPRCRKIPPQQLLLLADKRRLYQRPLQTERRKRRAQPHCRRRTRKKAAMSCPPFRSDDFVIARSAVTCRSPTDVITYF